MAGIAKTTPCRVCGDKALHQISMRVGIFIVWSARCRKHLKDIDKS